MKWSPWLDTQRKDSMLTPVYTTGCQLMSSSVFFDISHLVIVKTLVKVRP